MSPLSYRLATLGLARHARFDLALSASVEPLTISEPLLPAPSPKEAIEAVLTAARTVDSSVERTSLLSTALETCERHYQAFQFVVWAGKDARTALEAIMFETAGEA